MAHTLSELVTFVGEDNEAMVRSKQAVEWVASTSEGMAMLEEAYQLHGGPLTILVDVGRDDLGYGHDGKNMIVANPLLSEKQYFYSKNGEHIENSLERFFAHECKHATQPELLAVEAEYTAHCKALEDAYKARCEKIFATGYFGMPIEQYVHRLQACRDTNAILKILGEAYDSHIAPQFAAAYDDLIERSEADPVIKMVVDTLEVPAIQAENVIMGFYKGELERTEDYLRSEVLHGAHDKEVWCRGLCHLMEIRKAAKAAGNAEEGIGI